MCHAPASRASPFSPAMRFSAPDIALFLLREGFPQHPAINISRTLPPGDLRVFFAAWSRAGMIFRLLLPFQRFCFFYFLILPARPYVVSPASNHDAPRRPYRPPDARYRRGLDALLLLPLIPLVCS